MPTLGDDPWKASGHDRPAGKRASRGRVALGSRQRAFGVRLVSLRFFQLALGGHAAIDQTGDARHRRPRALDPRARLHDLRPLGRHAGRQRRDVETHQDVAGADAIAFGLWQFRDARRLRRHDRPVGARRRRHDAGDVDVPFDRADGREP